MTKTNHFNNMRWYEISWPAKLDSQAVNNFLRALNGNRYSFGIRFIILAKKNCIRHFLVLPFPHHDTAISLIHTFLPDIELTKISSLGQSVRFTAQLTISPVSRLLKTDNPEVISHAIINSLTNLHRDETIICHWVLGKRRAPQAFSRQTRSFQAVSWLGSLLEAPFRAPQTISSEQFKALNDKYKVTGWHSAFYIGISAATTTRQSELCQRILGAFRTAENPGLRIGIRQAKPKLLNVNNRPIIWPFTVNVSELTGLLGWPLGIRYIAEVPRITSKRLPLSSQIASDGKLIATSTGTLDKQRAITLTQSDALMHTHVLGPTGVGKTTLLLNLICQDMADGAGVIVIDPKGDLVESVLARIPKDRTNDVIVLDPNDSARPVGLNPLKQPNQSPDLTVDDILSVFHGLYGQYFGPRTQDILHAGLLTIINEPGMSLCALPMLYSNPIFRARLISKLNDPIGLGSFWNWFETISPTERMYAVAPLMNKLRSFLLRPNIRRVIGQADPKFNMTSALNNQNILLINLAKGQLGQETAQLFGSLMISHIWQAIQARSAIAEDKRKPCFVYIDEVQDYLHLPTDINDVLAQSRSYGVGLTLSHQHLSQLPINIRSGILANARSRICFQLSHEDAVLMAKDNPLLSTSDLENLSRFEIYLKIMANGETASWASGRTLAAVPSIRNPKIIRAASRLRYGRDAADIEAELDQTLAGIVNRQPNIGHKSKPKRHI